MSGFEEREGCWRSRGFEILAPCRHSCMGFAFRLTKNAVAGMLLIKSNWLLQVPVVRDSRCKMQGVRVMLEKGKRKAA